MVYNAYINIYERVIKENMKEDDLDNSDEPPLHIKNIIFGHCLRLKE